MDSLFCFCRPFAPRRWRGSASSSWPRDLTPWPGCASVRAESRWENGSIWTMTTFDVVETMKGNLPAQIAVRLPGGRVGHLISTVDGTPKFSPGNETVVFLQQSPAGGFTVAGWVAGKFPNFARSANRRRNRDAGFQRLRGFRRGDSDVSRARHTANANRRISRAPRRRCLAQFRSGEKPMNANRRRPFRSRDYPWPWHGFSFCKSPPRTPAPTIWELPWRT